MIYLLFADWFGERRLEQIRSLIDEEARAFNYVRLDGSQVALDELEAVSLAVPFLADRRVVIVDELSRNSLAAGASPDARGKRQSSKGRAGPVEQLFGRLPASTEFVLFEHSDAGFQGKLAGIVRRAGGTVAPRRSLSLNERRRWIVDRVREAGGSIDPDAANLVAETGPEDLNTLVGEVSKLVAYAGEDSIRHDDVLSLSSDYSEVGVTVFSFTDAVAAGNLAGAMRALRLIERTGLEPHAVIGAMAFQLRSEAMILALGQENKSSSEISREARRPRWLVERVLRRKGRDRLAVVTKIMSELAEFNYQFLQGQLHDPFVGIEMIATRIAGSTARRSSALGARTF